jgi:hypothetical protein
MGIMFLVFFNKQHGDSANFSVDRFGIAFIILGSVILGYRNVNRRILSTKTLEGLSNHVFKKGEKIVLLCKNIEIKDVENMGENNVDLMHDVSHELEKNVELWENRNNSYYAKTIAQTHYLLTFSSEKQRTPMRSRIIQIDKTLLLKKLEDKIEIDVYLNSNNQHYFDLDFLKDYYE